MSNFAYIEKQKEIDRERRNNTNRTMGKLCFDLAKIVFTAMIVGIIVSPESGKDDAWVVVLGAVLSVFLIIIGYNLTNKK